MTPPLVTPRGMHRRHFLGHLAATALGIPAAQFFHSLRAHAAAPNKAHKSCILLWMSGGPSHLDIWDLKPDSEKNGGPFRPIATSAPGVMISEHMPNTAKQMHHLNILRSLDSNEGNHERGTYLMHTGYVPNPTVVHPGWGSTAAFEIGSRLEDFDLPHCVSINTPGQGAGFLGMSYTPFMIQNPNSPIANLAPPADVDELRMDRRLQLLSRTENDFIKQRGSQPALDHKAVYAKTIRMMNSKRKDIFKLDTEPQEVRDAYGKHAFGSGCLLARKLVEQGVTYVEVAMGGWDTHADNFDALSNRLLPELDQGMAALTADLASRGLLDTTMIVWMGEFGRTPRINQNAGRDHWPRSWSVVMGGGGMKSGQVVGSTDKNGVDVTDRPIGVMDMVATMTKTMGIGLDTQYTSPRGRPMKVVDGGTPIAELVG
ncbi:DUF1501 domain-containing protein [Planctomyces sp. SH-PL62]|uniref:DUF1501 domain-containing protein n=1 Tax=Planctomyces sp. SH-PL62 TaxID=1636152 RepID=UPI00078DBD60|nr:DUF1501 domain-containing protein [Planctomyces sp. SH-PL62]AMV37125.1 hypothetical protein VT85_06815 [Planctomyces sp. SH-PL62]